MGTMLVAECFFAITFTNRKGTHFPKSDDDDGRATVTHFKAHSKLKWCKNGNQHTTVSIELRSKTDLSTGSVRIHFGTQCVYTFVSNVPSERKLKRHNSNSNGSSSSSNGNNDNDYTSIAFRDVEYESRAWNRQQKRNFGYSTPRSTNNGNNSTQTPKISFML